MNPVILTEVVEETAEATKTFAEVMNENPGVLQFAGLCLVAVGLIIAIAKLARRGKKR